MTNRELSQYLNSLDSAGCYHVERVLKRSDTETTELVFRDPAPLHAEGGAQGTSDASPSSSSPSPRTPPSAGAVPHNPFPSSSGLPPQRFIRKTISRPYGDHSLYRDLFQLQSSGMTLPDCLPKLYECYLTESSLVVVMEYIEGQSIEEIVKEKGASQELACTLFPRICASVTQLHSFADAPIIHRDLKPSNVIITPTRTVLIDLGISRWFKEDGTGDTTHFGTKEYAPPEQFGYRQTDERSDVYALGMLLYYLVCGWTPSANLVQEGFAHEKLTPPLRSVIVQATQFDPLKRYQSVGELHAAFMEAQKPGASAKVPASMQRAINPLGTRFNVVGQIWNIFVLAVFAWMLISCIQLIVNPRGSALTMPTWAVVTEYLLIGLGFVGPICYLLLDLRRIRKRFAFMERHTFRHDIAPCIAVMVASASIIGIIGLVT